MLKRLLVCSSLALTATAQVPDGWVIVSAQSPLANGGLYVTRPRPPSGNALRVSGLPGELTGLNDGQVRGAHAVEIDPVTGDVFVGESGPAGTTVELHRVHVDVVGGVATGTVLSKTVLGVSNGTNGGVTDMGLMPNGDLVFAVQDLVAQAPLNGSRLARFTPSTGAVAPIVTNAPPGQWIQAVAVDPTGTWLYFHSRLPGYHQGALYRVPVGGGSVTYIRMIAHQRGMTFGANGHIYSVSNTFGLELDPWTGALLGSTTFNRATQGVALERATQVPIYAIADGNGLDYIAAPAVNLWTGVIPEDSNGIAIMQTPVAYGAGTAGTHGYEWGGAPSLQSLPLRGNGSFSIQVDATPSAPQLGLIAFSAGPAATVFAGASVLIDLNYAAVVGLTTAGMPFPLPLPSSVPPGTRLYFQAAFPDAGLPGGIATSDGLRVGIVR